MRNNSHDDKLVFLQGLFVECPFGEVLDTCPMKNIRELPLKQRFSLVKQMNAEQLNTFIIHHETCSWKREEGLPGFDE
jgi:hypothetical protein